MSHYRRQPPLAPPTAPRLTIKAVPSPSAKPLPTAHHRGFANAAETL